MSNRTNAFLVVLDEPTHEDDAEPILAAIRQLRGVISVAPVESDCLTERIAEARVRRELGEKLFAVLYPKLAKE